LNLDSNVTVVGSTTVKPRHFVEVKIEQGGAQGIFSNTLAATFGAIILYPPGLYIYNLQSLRVLLVY
jgi:hypothetical protein